MQGGRKAGDLKLDIFDYPHIPYWFTLKQAMVIMQESMAQTEKCFHPPALLVFDEKYNLMGTVTMKEILKGLEPEFMSPTNRAQGYTESTDTLSVLWDNLISNKSKERAERPVNDVMVRIEGQVKPDDPVAKAAHLMISHNTMVLPVIADGKIVGMIRMKEVFEEIAKAVLE